ncbi:aldo/keto reductase [Staphylococcus aureus]
MLAGKYDENTNSRDHRTTRRDLNQVYLKKMCVRVKALESIAAAHQTSIANIVLAFYLTRPAIDVIIPGAKRADKSLKILKLQISFYQMMRFNISMNCFRLKTK